MSVDKIRAVYERCAPTYERGEWISERLFLARLRRRLVSRARGRVLEVGIGTGLNLPYYDPGAVITGVDLSKPMLEQALSRAHRHGRQLAVETMDAEALTFADQTFDAVVSTLTLCTTPDPVKVLCEMARVCRPRGSVLLLEHGLGTWAPINWVLSWLAPGQLRRYACHLTRDVAALPEHARLGMLHCERHLFGVFVLMQAAPGVC